MEKCPDILTGPCWIVTAAVWKGYKPPVFQTNEDTTVPAERLRGFANRS
jgi:hypothetical protein